VFYPLHSSLSLSKLDIRRPPSAVRCCHRRFWPGLCYSYLRARLGSEVPFLQGHTSLLLITTTPVRLTVHTPSPISNTIHPSQWLSTLIYFPFAVATRPVAIALPFLYRRACPPLHGLSAFHGRNSEQLLFTTRESLQALTAVCLSRSQA